MQASPIAGTRCLVVGGGGFIGTNLCLALVQAGAEVVGYGRRSHLHDALCDIDWVAAELSDSTALSDATKRVDLVFHLAGTALPAQSNADPAAGLEADVISSLRLLQSCRDSGVGRIVFVSSGGTVYGRAGPRPIAESAPTDPISAYGINKLTVEKYLALYEYLHGVEHVTLRVANPYGPYQMPDRPQGVISTIAARAIARRPFEVWGDGTVVRDFVYVDDVVRALLAAATYAGPERVFNVGSGCGRSLREVIASVESVVDRGPIEVLFRPGRAADVPVNVLDIDLIRREMDWRPQTDWLAGIGCAVDWLRRLPIG